ncbi:hypothetical protein AGMMS49974_02640 [Deltaproteobacteria bacterium]|nr:hypothetical protein AGMMS49974_02640 [Deltaproteobacteria bacterium]
MKKVQPHRTSGKTFCFFSGKRHNPRNDLRPGRVGEQKFKRLGGGGAVIYGTAAQALELLLTDAAASVSKSSSAWAAVVQ